MSIFQKGVNREFFLNWMVIDENLSWYIDDNINMFVKKPFTVNKEDDAFKLSNQIRGKHNDAGHEKIDLQACAHVEKHTFHGAARMF